MDKSSTPATVVFVSARRCRNLALIAALLLAVGGGGTIAAAEDAAAPHAARQRTMDDDHLWRVIHFVTARIDEPQKERVERLANAAFAQLEVFEREAEEARAPRGQILLADRVDRAALERARVAELHIADERSRFVDRLLVDVAAVLTSPQRALLRAEMTN